MKKSIARLPRRTQHELGTLLRLLDEGGVMCLKLILFGSYARGDYVLYDEYVDERGVRTVYQSDYDLLAITEENKVRITADRLERVRERYEKIFRGKRHADLQFIVEDLPTVNRQLSRGQYFFTEIVREGILLWDADGVPLAKKREPSFTEIRGLAQEGLEADYPLGEDFMEATRFFLQREKYKVAAFQLHQTAEHFYKAFLAVFTNYRPKHHRLDRLREMGSGYARELIPVFPLADEWMKECFDILCRAYVEGRYNPDFAVTREHLEYLIPRVELLGETVRRLCEERFAFYDAKIAEESAEKKPSSGGNGTVSGTTENTNE